MRIITAIASILIIIGALNWGLYGISKIDIVENLFGGWKNRFGRIVYILIGIAGLYSLLYVIFAWNYELTKNKTCSCGMFLFFVNFTWRVPFLSFFSSCCGAANCL